MCVGGGGGRGRGRLYSINSRRRSRSELIFAPARQHHALVAIIHSREIFRF